MDVSGTDGLMLFFALLYGSTDHFYATTISLYLGSRWQVINKRGFAKGGKKEEGGGGGEQNCLLP